MSVLERKIVITGDARNAEGAFDKMSDSAVDSFDRILSKTDEVTSGAEKLAKGSTEQIRKLDTETSSLFKSILKESELYSKNVKERSAYLDREIKQYEQINREEKKRYDIQARMRYEEKTKGLGSGIEDAKKEQQAKKELGKEQAENETRARMAQLQVEELKQKKADFDDSNESSAEVHDNKSVSAHGGGGGHSSGHSSGGGGHDNDHSGGHGPMQRVKHLGHSVLHGAAGALGFGALFSIGGIVHKLMYEGEELDKAIVRGNAMGVKSGSVLGLKTADAINYSKSVAQASWHGDVSKIATDQATIERGTGMELGTMNQFHTVMDSEQGKTLNQATLEMLGIMKKSGLYGIDKNDFSMMHKLLEVQNALNETQANKMEVISSSTSAQLMGSFGQVGGSFADQRQANTINTMNQAIVNPNNDFTQAFVMRSIKQRDPNASLLDVKLAQEEGVFKEGQFKGIMDDLSKTFSGDLLVFSASKALNLNLHQSKKLVDAYQEDPERFNEIGSKEDIEELPISNLKGKGVSSMEVITAKMDDQLSKYGIKAVHMVEGLIKTLESGGVKAMAASGMKDLIGMMAEGFSKGASAIKESIIGAMDTVTQKIGDKFGLHDEELKPEEVKAENKKAKGILLNESISGSFNEEDTKEFNRIVKAVENNDYKPSSSKRGEDIAEDILDDNEWMRSGVSLAARHSRQKKGDEVTEDFMKKHVEGNMQKYDTYDSLETKLYKESLNKVSAENPNKVRDDIKEYEETGKTTNKILLEILDIQKRVRERTPEVKTQENYSTTTAE